MDKRFELDISTEADKKFCKLKKKNPKRLGIIFKKIEEILETPYHFKPLRGNMQGIRRVHIDKSFVLIYEIKENRVIILDYDNHDKIYS